jgi:hypothetical protein
MLPGVSLIYNFLNCYFNDELQCKGVNYNSRRIHEILPRVFFPLFHISSDCKCTLEIRTPNMSKELNCYLNIFFLLSNPHFFVLYHSKLIDINHFSSETEAGLFKFKFYQIRYLIPVFLWQMRMKRKGCEAVSMLLSWKTAD